MKHITKVLMILGAVALLTVLASCEPIGYYLEQEEPLSSSTIRGNVFSMVPMNGNLYVQNGRVYRKPFAGESSWEEVSRPSKTRFVALASDASNVYAKDSDNNVWVAPNGSGWTKIYSGSGELFLFDNGVFDNTDGSTTNRVAYFRDNGGVKKLDGTNAPSAVAGASDAAKNCVHISGTDYFTDEAVVATDGTNIFAVKSDERVDNDTDCRTILWKAPNGSWTSAGTTATGYAVTSMAMGKDSNDNNVLLVGTMQNYEVWTIDANHKPASGVKADETSATIGSHSILGIWEYAGIRYASIYNVKVSNYNSLWYRKSSGKWDKA